MNIIVEATVGPVSYGSVRAVYCAGCDTTRLFRRVGNEDTILAEARGPAERLPGRENYALPAADGELVVTFEEKGCGCGHVYKRWAPPCPTCGPQVGAVREHAG